MPKVVRLRPSNAEHGATDSAAPQRRVGQEVQRLFEAISGEILSGDLAAGAKLSEPELARRYGISRGPLREAIRRLEERGLVRRTPNAGARVVDFTTQEILDAFDLREAVESMAARLAAERMTDAELAHLRRVYEAERERGRSSDYQNDFHTAIVRGARNSNFCRLFNESFYQLFQLWRRQRPWLRPGEPDSFQYHLHILEAIEARDGECAEILMRRHIRRLREHSLEKLRQNNAVTAGGTHADTENLLRKSME